MQKSITFHCGLKRASSNHFASMAFDSIQIYPPKSTKFGGEVHEVKVNRWLIYSKRVMLLTCSWRFFKSATALGRSASSTSYRRENKEKPFFPMDYEMLKPPISFGHPRLPAFPLLFTTCQLAGQPLKGYRWGAVIPAPFPHAMLRRLPPWSYFHHHSSLAPIICLCHLG